MLEQLFQNLLPFADEMHTVETLLFGDLQDDCHGTLLMKVVIIVANFLLSGIIIAGTISIIISGIQIITARDNANQIASGKKRILDTIIGIVAFGLMFVVLNLIIPGGVTLDSETLSSSETCPEVAVLPPPSEGGQPSQPGEPGVLQGECSGNMVEKDGFCWANTTIKAWDYDGVACTKYHSCQDANSSAWGSNCDKLASLNATEMLNGWPSSPHPINARAPSGRIGSTLTVPAPEGEDNNPALLCHGSLTSPTSKPGSPWINRIGFRRAVKAILTELEKGKPITIQAGNKRRGKWDNREARGRHFVTIVAVTKGLSTSNVDSAKIEFEDGKCIDGGEGHPEAWDQPVIAIGGTYIKFKIIDAWSARLCNLGDAGCRLYRLATNSWYFYTY